MLMEVRQHVRRQASFEAWDIRSFEERSSRQEIGKRSHGDEVSCFRRVE